MVEYFKLLFLTVLNCIIEFLPISSTAHNLILLKILSVRSINIDLFLSFLQLPITAVLCIYFFTEIKMIILTFFKKKETRIFCYKIILTVLPTVLFGLIFASTIKLFFYNSIISIAVFLIIGGVFMATVNEDKQNIKFNDIYSIDCKSCIKIGFCQMFSLLPGVSRSATTIYTALICGVEKSIAINYSFFISIPISFLACIYDIYKNFNIIKQDGLFQYCIFLFIAFIFSLIFIKKFIKLLTNNKLRTFGYYRIIVGLLIIIFGYLCHY